MEQDAVKIASQIQEKVLAKIVEKRGNVTIERDVPDVYRKYVIDILTKWTETHKYKLKVNNNRFTIYSPVVCEYPSNFCKECGKEKSNWLGSVFVAGIVSFVASANLIMWHMFNGDDYAKWFLGFNFAGGIISVLALGLIISIFGD